MQQNEDQTPYHGELNEAGQPSMRSILAEMDANNGLGAQVQLSGVDRHLVVEAAKNGLDVNTGEPLQPGQTPSPLEGTHPATHQEQADIAQPYQTEREEMARDEGQGQPNAKEETPSTLRKGWEVYNAETSRSALDRVDPNKKALNRAPNPLPLTQPNAVAVWKQVDQFRMHNPDPKVPVPLSEADFEAVLDDEFAKTNSLQPEKLTTPGYYLMQYGYKGDSHFFNYAGSQRRFVIAGKDDNGGKGFQANDINYLKVGMNAAAAGRSLEELKAMIAGYNGLNIVQHVGDGAAKILAGEKGNLLNSEPYRHNLRQMETGAYWAKVGYDAYLKRAGKSKP